MTAVTAPCLLVKMNSGSPGESDGYHASSMLTGDGLANVFSSMFLRCLILRPQASVRARMDNDRLPRGYAERRSVGVESLRCSVELA
jgi:hypothetical protein